MPRSFQPTFPKGTKLSIQNGEIDPIKGAVFTSYIAGGQETVSLGCNHQRLVRTKDGNEWELFQGDTSQGIVTVTKL